MISNHQIEGAVKQLSSAENVYFDARFLVEDVIATAQAFPEEEEFLSAIASTVRMLKLIAQGRVDVGHLSEDYEGWSCCHYQHRITQGTRATMRIMFARVDGAIRVCGFGNRRMPADFYRRMPMPDDQTC